MADAPSDQIATKVLFENDRVKVWEMRLEPGQTLPRHRHENDYVQIMLEGDRVAADIDPEAGGNWAGETYVEAEITNGLTLFCKKGGIENTINVGEKPFYQVIVELKG
jgi:hypothetical protein